MNATRTEIKKRISIPVVNSSSGKEEECQILDKLHETFKNTGSYMSFLFTREFVDWAKSKINVDFPPDAYDYIKNYADASELEEAKANVARLEKIEEDLRECLDLRLRVIEELQERQDKMERHITELSGWMKDRDIEIEELHSELAESEKTIVNLKVRLFDMMTEKENK